MHHTFSSALPHRYRLSKQAHFDHVFSNAKRVRNRYASLYVAPKSLSVSHQAFVASRKVGNAVVRNRCKRLMKEALRLSVDVPALSVDVILIAHPAMKGANSITVFKALGDLFSKGLLNEAAG